MSLIHATTATATTITAEGGCATTTTTTTTTTPADAWGFKATTTKTTARAEARTLNLTKTRLKPVLQTRTGPRVPVSPCPRVSRCSRSRRASVLLEVLVTVTIIAMFMGLIGAQILSSIRAAGTIDHHQTAMLLTESLASRLQAGGFSLGEQTQLQLTGDFGTVYPGWGWQVNTEPTDDPNVLRVTLQVLQGDPGQVAAGLGKGNTSVTQLTTFLTVPRKIDLIADMGMSEQDAAKFAASGGGLDPRAIDPKMLAHMNLNDLAGLMPQLGPLLSQFGLNMSDLGNLEALKSKLGSALEGLGGASGGSNNGSNNNNNDNKGTSSPAQILGELTRMASSGASQQEMQDYIKAHEAELNSGLGGGGG